MSDAIKAEIKKLEDRRFQAMIDSDFDTLDGLLGDGLVYTHSTGQSDTRSEYIAKCKNGLFKYRKIERPTENIQIYGDTAVVTGHTKDGGDCRCQAQVAQQPLHECLGQRSEGLADGSVAVHADPCLTPL